jgi:hypothetical protein
MNAYDYTRQQWVEGEEARQLLLSQAREDIELLTSDDGDEYAKLLNADRTELLNRRLADLASLEEQTPLNEINQA